MKRLNQNIRFLLLAVASVALCVSCAKELNNGGHKEESEVTFEITPNVSTEYENVPSTYASDGGGIGNVNSSTHKMRYILEVWSEDGTTKVLRKEQIVAIGTAPTFAPRLLSKRYQFAFWADFVLTSSITDSAPNGAALYYTADNLKEIQQIGIAALNDDAKDAYAASHLIDLSTAGVSATVTLKRPLAKLRIVALDANTIDSSKGANGCSVQLKYSTDLFTQYNVLDGTVSTSTSVTFPYLPRVYDDFGSAYGASSPNYSQTLLWDYVFVTENGLSRDVTIAIKDANGNDVKLPSGSNPDATRKVISGVELKRNALTTAVGNLFTVTTVTP